MSKDTSISLNPWSFAFILSSVEFAARIVKKTGVLDALDKVAKLTKTDADDKAVKLAKAILNVFAGESDKPDVVS